MHWSQTALPVKIGGISIYALIPTVIWIFRLSNLTLLSIAVVTIIFFVVVENVLHIKMKYLPSTIKHKILGASRKPKTIDIDF